MDYLKVQIKAYRLNRKDEYYTDKLDLYQSRPREHFMNNAVVALCVNGTASKTMPLFITRQGILEF